MVERLNFNLFGDMEFPYHLVWTCCLIVQGSFAKVAGDGDYGISCHAGSRNMSKKSDVFFS